VNRGSVRGGVADRVGNAMVAPVIAGAAVHRCDIVNRGGCGR
jgi:hypothetical protein